MTMMFRPDALDLELACDDRGVRPATPEETIQRLTQEVERLRAELDRICDAADRTSRERSELVSELAGVQLSADLPGDLRGADLMRAIEVLRKGHQEGLRLHTELERFLGGVRACPTTIVSSDGTKIPVSYNLQELAQRLTEILDPDGFPTTEQATTELAGLGLDPEQVRAEGRQLVERMRSAEPWVMPNAGDKP